VRNKAGIKADVGTHIIDNVAWPDQSLQGAKHKRFAGQKISHPKVPALHEPYGHPSNWMHFYGNCDVGDYR
jgi:hypothetical protein